jgi:hypothetical protein
LVEIANATGASLCDYGPLSISENVNNSNIQEATDSMDKGFNQPSMKRINEG